VLVGVCDGFVGNRMLSPYIREAVFLMLEEGALPQQVDEALHRVRLPDGPVRDERPRRLDIGWRIRKRRGRHRPTDQRYCEIGRPPSASAGRFGQKTGAGYYRYDPATARPHAGSPRLRSSSSRPSAAKKGITRRAITAQEIVERLVYALINEGAKILEEGIAQRPSTSTSSTSTATASRAYRGGPMCYADRSA
jgi:3-hydroxyacyl-CoA dehydrogenase